MGKKAAKRARISSESAASLSGDLEPERRIHDGPAAGFVFEHTVRVFLTDGRISVPTEHTTAKDLCRIYAEDRDIEDQVSRLSLCSGTSRVRPNTPLRRLLRHGYGKEGNPLTVHNIAGVYFERSQFESSELHT